MMALLCACVKKARTDTETRTDSETRGEAAKPVAMHSTTASASYSVSDKHTLLSLARKSLQRAVTDGKLIEVPTDIAPYLKVEKGCFVTLTIKGQLRGCIGNISPDMPLAEAIIRNARSAALYDSRFSPVTADELAAIEVEVSVLTAPTPLEFSSPDDLLKKLRPNVDGVVLKVGMSRSTFLPQVWEQLPDPNDFLNHLSAKAGQPAMAWRQPGTQVMIYQVEAFKESELQHD